VTKCSEREVISGNGSMIEPELTRKSQYPRFSVNYRGNHHINLFIYKEFENILQFISKDYTIVSKFTNIFIL